MAPFDKFTDRARRAMAEAQEEARRYGHDYLGTEHILLGMMAETEGLAARALAARGVEQAAVRAAIEAVVGRGTGDVRGEIALSPRTKQALELAVDEARRLKHHFIGTEHLLLGIMRQKDGVAAGVLANLGATLPPVRAHLDLCWRETARPSRPVRTIVEATIGRVRGRGSREASDSAAGRGDAAVPRANIVTCRIADGDLEAIDMLVESGVRTTRSDAAAWLIGAGITANRELFDKLSATIEQIRQLRAEAQAIVGAERGGGSAE